MAKKTAFITGVTGQDGSHLADHLLARGYRVFGMVRRQANPNFENIRHLHDRITLLSADMMDLSSIERALEKARPDEVYNLAAQSFVGASFTQPVLTSEVNALGAIKLLEGVRRICPDARYYQAGTSEMFGSSAPPQNEDTPFHPRSPYGVAKVFAHMATINYREAYGLHASNGILFNHEGTRRGPEFVTRKITLGVARVSREGATAPPIRLGNLEAKRDWGDARDFVRAMHLIANAPKPDDYVIATGVARSVREFLDVAFGAVGISDWQPYVEIDPELYRPAEVEFLCGDPSKAKKLLGWQPRVSFEQMVLDMLRNDGAILTPQAQMRVKAAEEATA